MHAHSPYDQRWSSIFFFLFVFWSLPLGPFSLLNTWTHTARVDSDPIGCAPPTAHYAFLFFSSPSSSSSSSSSLTLIYKSILYILHPRRVWIWSRDNLSSFLFFPLRFQIGRDRSSMDLLRVRSWYVRVSTRPKKKLSHLDKRRTGGGGQRGGWSASDTNKFYTGK